jgi:hypothetical protein
MSVRINKWKAAERLFVNYGGENFKFVDEFRYLVKIGQNKGHFTLRPTHSLPRATKSVIERN